MSRDTMLSIIEGDISRMLINAAQLTSPSKRRSEFRCSSLPFCPIRTFLSLSKREDSFGMDFYTSVGTALHELMQKWLPLSEQWRRIYGEWVCSKCGTVHPPQLKPVVCSGCGAPHFDLVYREVTVSYRGLSGHVDFIYEWSPGQYLLVDFKSTSLVHSRNKYPHNWREHYPPSANYAVQLKTYACLLREQYGLNITACMLIFVDRSSVIKTDKDFHVITTAWDNVKHDKLMKKIDRACDHNRLLQRLTRRVEEADSFSESALNTLKKIIATRPCQTEAGWRVWMKKGFFKGECELLPACLKGPKATLKAVLAKVEDDAQ